jgi:hypothetical protein
MASIAIRGRIEVPADALWKRLEDFGDVSWVPGIRQLEVRGSGPGMVRVVALGDAPPGEERLDRIDAAGRWLEYSVRGFRGDQTGSAGFPVRDYRGRMQVGPADGGCTWSWSVDFEPDGVSEDEAIAFVARLGTLLFRWLKHDLENA